MASFEFLAIILTGLGLTVSIVYYATVIRNQNITRRTQMLMELYSAYRDPEFAKAWGNIMNQDFENFDDYWERYGSEANLESWTNFQSVVRVFHGIGVLLKRNMIDIDLVEELMAIMVFASWRKMGPILIGFRERIRTRNDGRNDSQKYEASHGFEYLYNELKKRDQNT